MEKQVVDATDNIQKNVVRNCGMWAVTFVGVEAVWTCMRAVYTLTFRVFITGYYPLAFRVLITGYHLLAFRVLITGY